MVPAEDYRLEASTDLGVYRRPDTVAVQAQLFLSMYFAADKHFHLFKVSNDLTLTPLGAVTHRTGEFATDIRVASDANHLWYGIESVMEPVELTCGRNFLSAAIYDVLSGATDEPLSWNEEITTGCPTMIPFVEAVKSGTATLPEKPKAVDDPTPFFWNGNYYLMARGWEGPTQYLYRMDDNLTVLETIELGLEGALSVNEGISQNALVAIHDKVHLVAGVQDGPPHPGFSASIKAFPLSHDLRTVSGEATALVSSEDGYFTRVTAARFYNERLYFNYLERSTSGGTDQGYIGIYKLEGGTLVFQEKVLFQSENAADNHSSFELVDGRFFIFHQTPTETVAAKVFAPTR